MKQEVIDRVPTQVLDNGATRYGIYDENGTLLRYEYIKREDEPTDEGTAINRSLFNNLQGDIYTQDRFNKPSYSGTAMTLDLPLTSYETNKIVCITAPATLTNPTLNINGLGAKTVNGRLGNGKPYILRYNGTSFDIVKNYVTGEFWGSSASSRTINLGFTPSAVLVASAEGGFSRYSGASNDYIGAFAVNGSPALNYYVSGNPEILSVTEGGFIVHYNSNNNISTDSGRGPLKYIAFV